MRLGAVLTKYVAPELDGLACLARELLIEMQVVQCVEPGAEHFVAAVQVVQVGARVVGAGVALAGFVDRSGVVAVARVLQLDVAETG